MMVEDPEPMEPVEPEPEGPNGEEGPEGPTEEVTPDEIPREGNGSSDA